MVNLDNQNLHPEDSGVKTRPVLMFLVILAVSTGFVFVMIYVLLWGFDKLDAAKEARPATMMTPPGGRMLPPEPLLQGAPGSGSTANTNAPTLLPLDDMKVYRDKMAKRVDGYGWVDQNTGVGYMPIEEAKRMVMERGLPMMPNMISGMEKAEMARREVLNSESNSGRMIESGAQATAAPMINQGGNAVPAGGASPSATGGTSQGMKPAEARPIPEQPGAQRSGATQSPTTPNH